MLAVERQQDGRGEEHERPGGEQTDRVAHGAASPIASASWAIAYVRRSRGRLRIARPYHRRRAAPQGRPQAVTHQRQVLNSRQSGASHGTKRFLGRLTRAIPGVVYVARLPQGVATQSTAHAPCRRADGDTPRPYGRRGTAPQCTALRGVPHDDGQGELGSIAGRGGVGACGRARNIALQAVAQNATVSRNTVSQRRRAGPRRGALRLSTGHHPLLLLCSPSLERTPLCSSPSRRALL